MFFEDNIDDSKYRGHLYGLGTSFIMNGNFHDNGDNSSSSWICNLKNNKYCIRFIIYPSVF